jgi:hypothetical protein
MSKRYTGGVVSSAVPTVNAAGASGIFTLGQQASAQSNNNWPPFKVEKSLRFRSGAYLTRTPAASSNRTTWTWSGWIKRGPLSGYQTLFLAGASAQSGIQLHTSTAEHGIDLFNWNGSAYDNRKLTSVLLRDPAAWYHIVCVMDTTNATAADRLRIYINGTRVANFTVSSDPTQNYATQVNNAVTHSIGRNHLATDNFDGYMSEVNFIDGLALTPSSFGATDKDGNWSPIAYTGVYGQNGFYLNYKDASSASAVAYDYSGNGNNWTPTAINVTTANTTYDSMIDVPSDQASANVRANYATLNLLDPKNGTQSNANLTHAMGSNDFASARSTIGMKGGKWYWETKCETTLQSNFYMGIGITADGDYSGYNYIGSTSGGYSYDGRATKLNNNSSSSYGASYTLNDIIGVALDLDNGTIEYYKNGASQGVAFTGIDITRTYYAAHWIYTTQISYNFGQQPFTYTPPTGFKSLNTYNLSEPAVKQPNKYFDINLYSGAGSTPQTITNSGFQPDLVWTKPRSSIGENALNDSVRGSSKLLIVSSEGAEATDAQYLTSFNSNGYSLGTNNWSGTTVVGWQWNAGGSTVTNTSGSISAQVRANPTAGFSILTYTGNGTNATVGHGLGASPAFIIVKKRSSSDPWVVYHQSLGVQFYSLLNSTAASYNNLSNYWGSTTPSSTTFGLGPGYGGNNTNGSTYVAYCWSEIEGYSKFGKYTANASSNGPFIYTGFRPKFLMVKRSSGTGTWMIVDSARDTYNPEAKFLEANDTDAEASSEPRCDFVSNGFKVRAGSGYTFNETSGDTYIYMAFAETPFKYARSR